MTYDDIDIDAHAESLVDYVDSMRKLEKEGVVRWVEESHTWVYTDTDENPPLMLNPDLIADEDALD